jgi:hypothetical protein
VKSIWGCSPAVFLKTNCDVKIIANFASKITKMVEITLEKHIYPEIPRFSCRKKKKFAPKKEHCFTSVVGFI